MKDDFIDAIFADGVENESLIWELFRFQYNRNSVYRQWCDCFHKSPNNTGSVVEIPFLPVAFFKLQKVVCGQFVPEAVFESSGTTGSENSKHFVKDLGLYRKSFLKTFEEFYGPVTDYCIIGLLPSYLERQNSSLIQMTDDLIKLSRHEMSGYYLSDFAALASTLQSLESAGQKTLLFGVTFALLDFAEKYGMPLYNTVIMDTGGMKGRKKEMTREEVHKILKDSFSVPHIHSEYGMTELLSQAYTIEEGVYQPPKWLKILVREETDPLTIKEKGKGMINLIDMANVYSCAFLATDDVGTLYNDNRFSVWGRRDNSDLRGCSLMVV